MISRRDSMAPPDIARSPRWPCRLYDGGVVRYHTINTRRPRPDPPRGTGDHQEERMAEQYVGKTSEFKDGVGRIVIVPHNEIRVLRHNRQFYPYRNSCLH